MNGFVSLNSLDKSFVSLSLSSLIDRSFHVFGAILCVFISISLNNFHGLQTMISIAFVEKAEFRWGIVSSEKHKYCWMGFTKQSNNKKVDISAKLEGF